MTVRRRHVLFFAGFDPKGAAYYHGLYRRESARQARLQAPVCQVGPRERLPGGNQAWQVWTQDGSAGERTHTTVEHMRWDDVVRREWPKGVAAVAAGALRAYAHALSLGRSLGRVWRVAPMTLVALAWPGLCWLLVLLAALGAGYGLAQLVWTGWPQASRGAGVLAGAVPAFALLRFAWHMEQRWNTTWLLRIYRFADRWSRAQLPELDQRLDAAALRLRQVLADPELDEVLVVGYSVGSILAVRTLAEALSHWPRQGAASLALLTLGHCVPLSGLTRGSLAFRQALGQVADAQDLFWVDVSSPTDWGSFALTDPVQLCLGRRGINPRAMTSPRFHTLFDPERYLLLRRDKRRMHLQYLMAGERAGGYNFFDLTAGPQRLMEHPWTPAQPKSP